MVGRDSLSCSLALHDNSEFCFRDFITCAKTLQPLLVRARTMTRLRLVGSHPPFLRHNKNGGLKSDLHFVNGGQGWIRTTVDSRRQIYSLLPLATRAPTQISCPSYSFLSKRIAGNRNRTYNLRFTKPLLYR